MYTEHGLSTVMTFGDKNISILHLASMDYGGAGNYSLDLHKLMMAAGFNSYLVVKDKRRDCHNVFAYPDHKTHKIIPKIRRKIAKSKITDDIFEHDYHFYNRHERIPIVAAKGILKLLPKKPDVIFFHWVTDYVNSLIMNDLKRLSGADMYWLMIDNAPLTGGCHYPWNCNGYQQLCENCPAIKAKKFKMLAKMNLEHKAQYLPADLSLITYSSSDYERAKKSALFKSRNIIKMMIFVDENKFEPGNKTLMKSYWGLDQNKKVIFCGLTDLKDKRKGYAYLVEALNSLECNNAVLLIAGKNHESSFSLESKYVGFLPEDELVKAYQAADLFICPSIEDSGPIMINQSIMCGTPVVAFNTGVALDLVVTGKTGYLAERGNTEDLRKGISMVLGLDDDTLAEWQKNCRQTGLHNFSKEIALKNHVEPFKIDTHHLSIPINLNG